MENAFNDLAEKVAGAILIAEYLPAEFYRKYGKSLSNDYLDQQTCFRQRR